MVHLHLTHTQIAKVKKREPIQISHHAIGHPQGTKFHHIHPENMKKLQHAHKHKKGVRLHLTPAECHGTGFFQDVGNFFKKNATPILDTLEKGATALFPEFSPLISGARQGIKAVTGKGLKTHKKHNPHHLMHGGTIHHAHKQGAHQAHKLSGPGFFPGQHIESPNVLGFGVRKHKKKHPVHHSNHMHGYGIIPPGY